MKFSDADAHAIYLALADRESGTPRQWLYLELAAEKTAGAVTRAARFGLALLRWGGLAWAIPYLDLGGLAGLRPYRSPLTTPYARWARYGALSASVVLAILLGLGSLNATRELAMVLLAGLGASGCVGAVAWQQGRAAAAARQNSQQQAERLTPAESTLGLAGMLAASGEVDDIARQVALIRRQPDIVLTAARSEQLGLSEPLTCYVVFAASAAGLCWLLGVLAVAWSCWLTPKLWQAIPALLGIWLVGFVGQDASARWVRIAAIDSVIALGAGFATWLWLHLRHV